MLLLQWVRRLSRLKEEWSYSWRFWMFRSSGVLNITILSISLLEYLLPAWPHLLNWRWISKPVCLFTTWLGNSKELSSAKITLPDFSFKLRIDQGRKRKHIKTENIHSKISSLFIKNPVFCLCRLRWLRLTKVGNLNISRQRTFTQKISSLFIKKSCLLSLPAALTAVSQVRSNNSSMISIEKWFLPNSSWLSHGVSKIPSSS